MDDDKQIIFLNAEVCIRSGGGFLLYVLNEIQHQLLEVSAIEDLDVLNRAFTRYHESCYYSESIERFSGWGGAGTCPSCVVFVLEPEG